MDTKSNQPNECRRSAMLRMLRMGGMAAIGGLIVSSGGCKAVEGVHRAKTNFRRRVVGKPPIEAEPDNPYER